MRLPVTSARTSHGGAEQPLLDACSVTAYLRDRGLVAPDARVTARHLGGGVSNVVLIVEGETGEHRGLVVKQALGCLNVPEPWTASQRRTLTEGVALRMAGEMTPGRVPTVIDLDTDRLVLVIEAAPATWASLKDELMAGAIDTQLAEQLGDVLATWHNATAGLPQEPDWADPDALQQLRTDPYHRTTAARNPDLAEPLHDCLGELERMHACLVHGDFSPKNVMVGPEGFWVLDFEAAHVGAPVFDPAFFTCHLVLKAVHRPAHRDAYQAASAALWERYQRLVADALRPAPDRLALHTACFLLARVDGRSPAEYLDAEGRRRVHALAADLLRRPAANLEELWGRLDDR